jgi:hypothetical protein
MVCVVSICGCARKPAPTAREEPTKTVAEYKAEADKQITEQNASDELQKLEQAVAQDANEAP